MKKYLHLNFTNDFKKIDSMLSTCLLNDLLNYGINPKQWYINFTNCTEEGHEFELSGIEIINNSTEETFEGWSEYIAKSSGEELYIFWDNLYGEAPLIKKYNVKEKIIFGVPPHIQKQFSDRLKQEIIDEKHCGATCFIKSPFLGDVIKELLGKKTEYYNNAVDMLKRIHDGKVTIKDLEKYDMSLEDKLSHVEINNKSMGLKFFQNKKIKTFIKYDKFVGKFLIINNKKEIIEYWQMPEEDLDRYVQENNYEIVDEEYFNLYFGLITD